eukprot:7154207-Alexandrium_andersonii.AAC.1
MAVRGSRTVAHPGVAPTSDDCPRHWTRGSRPGRQGPRRRSASPAQHRHGGHAQPAVVGNGV